MSDLNCPVCKGAMKEVNKQGVTIDTCTQCRGVWLDRGELEKLVGIVDQEATSFRAASVSEKEDRIRQRPALVRDRFDDDDDDDDERRGQGPGGTQKRSKMSRLMDFFD